MLRRPLFDPATYGRIRFHHRSIQEYLAARHLEVLRKHGMPKKGLFRLFFAERCGIKVVIPSMREIASWVALWDEGVRKELIKREPETLLSYGDPVALDVPSRDRLIRKFVSEGNWRDLDFDQENFLQVFRAALVRGERKRANWVALMPNVRRFADPKLAPLIRKFLKRKNVSSQVRELLLQLTWLGSGPINSLSLGMQASGP